MLILRSERTRFETRQGKKIVNSDGSSFCLHAKLGVSNGEVLLSNSPFLKNNGQLMNRKFGQVYFKPIEIQIVQSQPRRRLGKGGA